MRHNRRFFRLATLSLCGVALVGCAGTGDDASEDGTRDEIVVVSEQPLAATSTKSLSQSFAYRVEASELVANYPAERVARIDPAALKADAIVGWYDKGHNYHKEHMKASEFGDIVINPAAFKGKGL